MQIWPPCGEKVFSDVMLACCYISPLSLSRASAVVLGAWVHVSLLLHLPALFQEHAVSIVWH
jgi:hypothetical protein